MRDGDPQKARKSAPSIPRSAISTISRGRQPRDGTGEAGRTSGLKRETTIEQSIRARRMLSARERYALIKQSEMRMDTDGAFATQSRTSYASAGERCIFWCIEKAQKLSRNSLMHIFLLMMIVCYTVCGAILFEAIEGGNEKDLFLASVDSKRKFFQALRELGSEYTKNLSSPEEFEETVFNLMKEYYSGVELCLLVINKSWGDVENYESPWSFWNSIIFSATTYSTIGYGNVVPKTHLGRAATIVYAIIGIPLFLTFLAHLGILLTKWIKRFWGFVRRCYYTGTCSIIRKERHVQQAVNTVSEFYERNVYASYSDFEDSESTDYEERGKTNKTRESSDKTREKPREGLDASKEKQPAEKSRRVLMTSVDKSKEKLSIDKPKEPTESVNPLKGRALTDNRPWPHKSKDHVSDSSSIIITSSVSSTSSSSVLMFEDEFHLPITLGILILVAYIFLGAILYMYMEDWTYVDSVYFVFVSMATIGYGDFVPDNPIYMVCSIGYLAFGLSLTAMCINVAKIKINATFARARDRVGERIGIDV